MYSNLTLLVIELYVNVCNILNNTPYVWDTTLKTIKLADSIPRKMSFYLAYGHSVCYLCFLLLRLKYFIQGFEFSFVTLSWMIIWINFYVWACVTFYNGDTKKHESVALFRGLQKLTREFQRGINDYNFCTFCLHEIIYFYRK
jgi:hypothetical protein